MNGLPDDLFERYESQYTRTRDGRLIHVEKATLGDLDKEFPITIDEKSGLVTKAVPVTDEQGNLKHDAEGKVVPRLTTIYDAALKLFGHEEARRRIPVLCHQHHLTPVGVCRVCSVLTERDGKPGDRLIPACQHPVNQEDMRIHTGKSRQPLVFADGQRREAGSHVRAQVKVLLELLAVNHLHRDQPETGLRYENELLGLVRDYEVPLERHPDHRIELPQTPFRWPGAPGPDGARSGEARGEVDTSSEVIAYDPNNCILCDRCVRGCSEIRPFQIIGHTGFGKQAVISFDLGKPMGQSECVSCGECAVSCPTGALTFRRGVYRPDQNPWQDEPLPGRPEVVTAEELTTRAGEKIRSLFAGVPFAFLKWNERAVGRLALAPGKELCRQGHYGTTAFLIETGSISIFLEGQPEPIGERGPEDIIVGEMACLSHQPRNATLRAGPAGATVLVIKRNLLYMLQRNAQARAVLAPIYADRALRNYLSHGQLFGGLTREQSAECIKVLEELEARWEEEGGKDQGRRPLLFSHVNPGQTIVRQGDRAEYCYILSRGHVSVSNTDARKNTIVRDYLGPGQHFGEIGLLSDPEVSPRVANAVAPVQRGRRTATCTALDHVGLLRVTKDAFRAVLQASPEIRAHLETRALQLLRKNVVIDETIGLQVEPFTGPGLYQGRKLLVLDLNRCTRCQECVKACAASHDGVTRLLLEGNRFGHYLVPSACRSCYDPVCLVGCPVDAIHRRPSSQGAPRLAIVIEDYCIGCGLCAHNCPFGSIHMTDRAPGQRRASTSERIATNCNLCEDSRLGFTPQCELRCPHDAALHLDGFELAKKVGLNPTGPLRDVGQPDSHG
jgi:CRP-like cAMP-binding protein/Fe-S-cluster-containing hydrogenase component 2